MDTQSQQHKDGSVNPVVLELVYEKLLSSVSIDIAATMHRLMKQGIYPSSELLIPKSRSEIYPEVYGRDKTTVEEEEHRYSVFVPQRNKRKRLGEKAANPYEDYVDAQYTNNNTTTNGKQQNSTVKTPDPAISATTNNNNNNNSSKPPVTASSNSTFSNNTSHLDIWGKAPAKEPKEMIECLICGRQVNTLRFAPHLDKCMGIGTTVRAAALAASGFVPQQHLSSGTSATARGSSNHHHGNSSHSSGSNMGTIK